MFRCKTTPCSEKMKDLAMACVISCPCIFFIRCADNYVAVKHVLPSCGKSLRQLGKRVEAVRQSSFSA